MESFLQAIPLIMAGIVPPLLAWVRRKAKIVPDRYVPVLLPIAGGIVGALASLAGVDIGDLNALAADADTWNSVVTGVLSGLASNGVHQIGKQLKKPPDPWE